MTTPKRIELAEANGISSIYKRKFRPKERLDISQFNNSGQRGNFICPDMFEALKKLDSVVRMNGGHFYIIDLFRSWAVQAKARQEYKTGKKRAFVAKPGGSFHNGGRAVDISVKELNFIGMDKDEWLKYFWDLAIPLGFQPIIKIPDLGVSECWHYDYPGTDWQHAYDKVHYTEIAKCATLDVGEWDPSEKKEKVRKMFIQAQLIRLGYYEIGRVDGILGSKTNKVLEFLGVKSMPTTVQAATLLGRVR